MLIRNQNEQIAYDNLIVFHKVASKIITPLILDGGALLGAYRDGGFCEGDWNDTDFTTFKGQYKKLKELTPKLIDLGFDVYHEWSPATEKSGQIAYKKNGCKIDIMFKEIKGDRAWWCVYKPQNKGQVYKSVPATSYTELATINLGDIECLCPADLNKYLTIKYGDYNKKVHRRDYSCYTSDKAIVESYENI